jgi:uncharacterized protein YneF (UPF0154 family)
VQKSPKINSKYLHSKPFLCPQAVYQMMGNTVIILGDESTPEKRINKIFRQMDKDSDERLSLDEFIAGARRDPMLARLLWCAPNTRY